MSDILKTKGKLKMLRDNIVVECVKHKVGLFSQNVKCAFVKIEYVTNFVLRSLFL